MSENTFAALTNAVSESAARRRRVCSTSSWRGVAMNMPSSSAASSPGISHDGPIVSRGGNNSCRPIAARIVAWAGQNGSDAAGGG